MEVCLAIWKLAFRAPVGVVEKISGVGDGVPEAKDGVVAGVRQVGVWKKEENEEERKSEQWMTGRGGHQERQTTEY